MLRRLFQRYPRKIVLGGMHIRVERDDRPEDEPYKDDGRSLFKLTFPASKDTQTGQHILREQCQKLGLGCTVTGDGEVALIAATSEQMRNLRDSVEESYSELMQLLRWTPAKSEKPAAAAATATPSLVDEREDKEAHAWRKGIEEAVGLREHSR